MSCRCSQDGMSSTHRLAHFGQDCPPAVPPLRCCTEALQRQESGTHPCALSVSQQPTCTFRVVTMQHNCSQLIQRRGTQHERHFHTRQKSLFRTSAPCASVFLYLSWKNLQPRSRLRLLPMTCQTSAKKEFSWSTPHR